MALDPKWSEEARKNVKETSIDQRMYDRMIQQRERIAADREAQNKIKAAAAMPAVPSYASAVQQPVAPITHEPAKEVLPSDDFINLTCERIVAHIKKVIREEVRALVEEGRLK